MKRVLSLTLCICLLFLALTACGGGQPAANDQPDADTQSPSEENADGAQQGGGFDLTTLADRFSEALMGVTEAGETIYYACSQDNSLAILLFYDITSNKSVSYVGPLTQDGTSATITDLKTSNSFTISMEAATEGGVIIDTGDSGYAVMGVCSVMEVLESMQKISDYSQAIQ